MIQNSKLVNNKKWFYLNGKEAQRKQKKTTYIEEL